MNDNIYDMKLHEEIDLGNFISVLRVPGGWIYTTNEGISESGYDASSCFVPYSKEFRPKQIGVEMEKPSL